MQPIIHFLVSIVAGVGVGLHLENIRKKYFIIILLAFITTCIDLDHLLPIYHETGVKVLHNIFVFIFIPVAIFLGFCLYEKGKETTFKQRVALLVCVMMVGNMFLDAISDGVPLFYPFRTEKFMVGNIGMTLHPTIFTLTSDQVIMIFFGIVICGANLLESLTYKDVEEKKPFELEWKTHKLYEKRKRSWLPEVFSDISLRNMQVLHGIETGDNLRYEEKCQHDEITKYIFDFIDNLPEMDDHPHFK